MLKDKIENDNYAELCEKAYKFITNGVVLPPQEKDQFAEVMKNLTSGLTQAIQNGGNIVESLPKSQINDKEEKLRELANRNLKRLVTYKDIPCYICGYSVDFDCLIAGYNNGYGSGCFLSPDDKFIDGATYNHYLYVPKDIVKE
jgi:hypothetical protein